MPKQEIFVLLASFALRILRRTGGFWADMVDALLARMEGTVIIPEGLDVTAPALDEPFLAHTGKLHW